MNVRYERRRHTASLDGLEELGSRTRESLGSEPKVSTTAHQAVEIYTTLVCLG